MPSAKPLHRLMTSSLGVAIVLGSAPMTTASANGLTQVGTVSFDRAGESLVIPISGPQPSVQLRKLAPRQYVADLQGAAMLRSDVQGQRLDDAQLTGWSMDETPDGHTVRLRLTTNDDVQPNIELSREGGDLRVEFHGALASRNTGLSMPALPTIRPQVQAARPSYGSAAIAWLHHFVDRHLENRKAQAFHVPSRPLVLAPSWVAERPTQPIVQHHAPRPVVRVAARPVITPAQAPAAAARIAPRQAAQEPVAAIARLAQPHYDAARNLLVVPVAGELDAKRLGVIHLNTRWAYLDVPNSRPTFTGVRFENRHDALFQRWVMAKRPESNTTRISFALGAAADISVKAERHDLLVAVRPHETLLGALPAPTLPHVRFTSDAPVVAAKPVANKPTARVLAQAPVKLARRPYFDESRYGLVIPYSGTTPLYRWEQKGDRGAVLDLRGDIRTSGTLLQRFEHHPVMQSWRLQRDGSNIVRVALDFNRDADLVLAADPVHKQLLLIPQPRLPGDDAQAKAAPAEPKTILSAVQRDLTSQEIYIPFSGPTPSYSIEQVTPTFAYVNFAGSSLQPEGVHFFAPAYNPTLNYWLFSERPHMASVRLALALTQPGRAKVFEDRLTHRLVVVVNGAAPRTALAPGRTALLQPLPWPGTKRTTAYRHILQQAS
ncbi:MAG TPA: hypothetical protein V6D47_07410 [Oscillatoriaceae cyanobacterium]